MPLNAWPALPLAEWRDTCDTIHMYAQIAGKTRLALAPPEPEWAHVSLRVTPRGLTTGVLPYKAGALAVDFDFLAHAVDLVTSDGRARRIPLRGQSVAEFYREYRNALEELGIEAHIWEMPQEVPNPIPFSQDTVHASYDRDAVERFHAVLLQAELALQAHRAPFRGRHTAVQFFWGTFDLAYARFSGKPATPPSNDVIMREAMDAEEVCAGFWPGDDRFPEPAFWCYSFPKPDGFEKAPAGPAGAAWNASMGEFVLPYEAARTADAPAAVLRDFFTATFNAGSATW